MSPSVLPEHIRLDRAENLRDWLAHHRGHPLLLEPELDTIQRLIDYLDVVEDPHHRASDLVSRRCDFKAFYQQYDMRRGKNFRQIFPKILVDWYDSLPDMKLEPRLLISGDAAEGYHSREELLRLAEREGIVPCVQI